MIDFSVDINDLVAQLERDSTVSIEEKTNSRGVK